MPCVFQDSNEVITPVHFFFLGGRVLFCLKFWHSVKTGFNELQVFFRFTFYKKKKHVAEID